MTIEANPQHVKPRNSGQTVVSIKAPIRVAMNTPITVEIKPLIAAPTPAICPIGCMARALRLPNKNPMAVNCRPKKTSNIHKGGFTLFINNNT